MKQEATTQPIPTEPVVDSPHPLATKAGVELLRRGASAAEASVAIAAVLGVVWPHLNGLGGDAFFLVFDGEKVRALNATGFSGEQILTRKELASEHGPGAIFTVPGAVSGWQVLLNGAPFTPELLNPAIKLAEEGVAIDGALQHGMPASNGAGWRDAMAGREGDLLKQPQLAETLRLMANGKDFYCGKISSQLCETFAERGVGIGRADFHFQHAEWIDPVCDERDDCEIWTPPQDAPALAHGDTVAFSVVDEQGRAVSAMQTLYRKWGSGIWCPRTGILLQNSSFAFSSDPLHAGSPAPRQRALSRLAPVLVTRGGNFLREKFPVCAEPLKR